MLLRLREKQLIFIMKFVLIRKESTTKGGLKMAKAYINGTEVTIYEYRGEEALCYIPALDIKGWYKQNLIEVRYV